MGFFSKLKKSLNPVNLVKNPKQALSYAFDPAGTAIRAGSGQPMTLRSGLDPTGQLLMKEEAARAAPNSYRPSPRMQLSPAAQKLMDDMKARSAQRAAARQQAMPMPGQQAAPQQLYGRPVMPLAPAVQGVVSQARPEMGVAPQPRMAIGMMRQPMGKIGMADGGKVGGDQPDGSGSKVFNRKPNGKPY